MSSRRCASVVLALVVSACVSSSTPGGEVFAAAARARGGNSRLIVRAQLDELSGYSAYEAVETLNRRWLQPQRGSSLASGQSFARVMIDGNVRREINDLARMSTDNIETMRYLSAPDATTKYGTGYPGGVIEVTLRRR